MASVLLSSTITELSGKVGGGVFQKNAHGLFLRSNPSKNANNSQRRLASNLSFLNCVQTWNSLSNTQRTSFVTFAPTYTFHDRFGRAFHPNAYQLFIYLNRNLMGVSNTIVSTCVPQTVQSFTNFDLPSVSASTSHFDIVNSVQLPLTWANKVFISPPYKTRLTITYPRWQHRLILPYNSANGGNFWSVFVNAGETLPAIGDTLVIDFFSIELATGVQYKTHRNVITVS
jgi:hypothetical protein